MTGTAPQQPARRARGAAESLASIVLAFESIIAFLGGLVIYGLKALPEPIEPWWGIVAGSVVAVLMILTGRFVRYLRVGFHPNYAAGPRASTTEVPDEIIEPTAEKVLKLIRG